MPLYIWQNTCKDRKNACQCNYRTVTANKNLEGTMEVCDLFPEMTTPDRFCRTVATITSDESKSEGLENSACNWNPKVVF